MSQRKIRRLVTLNAAIVLINIAVFSNAIFGLSLFEGPIPQRLAAWIVAAISAVAFVKGNLSIMNKPETRYWMKNITSLDGCMAVFEEAIHNGDVFDEDILKSIGQIKQFRRKNATIRDILQQKFSPSEMSYQKFISVLQSVEHVICMNMRGIINKIAAFDMDEYQSMQKKMARGESCSPEKISIYNEYIAYVHGATKTGEDILLKLDRLLLEISRYNSLEDGDIQKLPAMMEMDDLIKNADLYR